MIIAIRINSYIRQAFIFFKKKVALGQVAPKFIKGLAIGVLAEKCEIDENLTSYVSRHSFASRAKNMGIDVASISELMGHQDLQTTQIYLDSLPSDLLDEIHEKIIS